MPLFDNLRTANKLLLAFGSLLVGFVALLLLGQGSLQQIQDAQRQLYQRDLLALQQIAVLNTNLNAERARLLAMTLLEDAEQRAQREADLLQRQQEDEAAFAKLTAVLQNDAALLESVRELQRGWREVTDYRQKTVLPLLRAGKLEEARGVVFGDQDERINELRFLAEGVSETLNAHTAQTVQAGEALIAQQRQLFLGAGAALVLLALFLIWSLTHAIAAPMTRLTQAAERISRGELSQSPAEAESRRVDEVGRLEQAFARMSRYLQALAGKAELIAQGNLAQDIQPQSEADVLGKAFAAMVANLRRLTQELHEGINVLASASQEILTSTSQLATSTQETATAISEIATTIQEVKQTAVLASDKAKTVSDAAQRTAQVSLSGRQAVDVTLERMNQIRDQVQAVAESIMRLSEQSQAIAEIVATVNDLAEQSNLLGVNASIEAVKAGEQGKGFSVVAQEVKALADQSKQATAQVRAILADIQKAMTKTVLATEQSGKAVDSGYAQAEASGEAIRALADNIGESSGAALQIAASSQQQLVGTEQIATAMENIRVASQDNVAGTKQTELAAKNLHQLGLRLKQLAGQFQL